MSDSPVTSHGVRRSFGTTDVLRNLDLELRPGDFYGLVGLNGAGKTTLIRHLLGLLRPDAGEIRVFGEDPWSHRAGSYRRIGVILEHDGFAGNLTFRRNMEFFSRVKGLPAAALDEYLEEFWSGTSIRTSGRKVKHFSRGQKMQASICRAFLGWPELCVFDEPVVALDLEAYEHFCFLVEEARRRGCTMLISSHVLEPIERFCNRVGLLRNGILQEISPGEPERWWVVRVNGVVPSQDEVFASEGIKQSEQRTTGEWRIAVDNPDRCIPKLVQRLVQYGVGVLEVRPEEISLRERLRRGQE